MEDSTKEKFQKAFTDRQIKFCSFPTCKINIYKEPNAKFFQFPENKEKMAFWCKCAGRTDWMKSEIVDYIKSCTFFCHHHFADHMFVDKQKSILKECAYPHSVSTTIVSKIRDPASDAAASSNKTAGPFVEYLTKPIALPTPIVPQVREQTNFIVSRRKCDLKVIKKSAFSLQSTSSIQSLVLEPNEKTLANNCAVPSCLETARRGSFLCTKCQKSGYKACAVHSCQRLFRTSPPNMTSVAPYVHFPKDKKEQSKWKRILKIRSMHHIYGKSVKPCKSKTEDFLLAGCILNEDAVPFSNTAQESSALCIRKRENSSNVENSAHFPSVDCTVDTNSRRAHKKRRMKYIKIKAALQLKKLKLQNENLLLRNLLLKQRIEKESRSSHKT